MTKRKRNTKESGNPVPRRSRRINSISNRSELNNEDNNIDDTGVDTSSVDNNVASITQSARIASRSQRRTNQISAYSPEYHRSRTNRNKFVSPSQKVTDKNQVAVTDVNPSMVNNKDDECLSNDDVHGSVRDTISNTDNLDDDDDVSNDDVEEMSAGGLDLNNESDDAHYSTDVDDVEEISVQGLDLNE